jgi:hypothetical protein
VTVGGSDVSLNPSQDKITVVVYLGCFEQRELRLVKNGDEVLVAAIARDKETGDRRRR